MLVGNGMYGLWGDPSTVHDVLSSTEILASVSVHAQSLSRANSNPPTFEGSKCFKTYVFWVRLTCDIWFISCSVEFWQKKIASLQPIWVTMRRPKSAVPPDLYVKLSISFHCYSKEKILPWNTEANQCGHGFSSLLPNEKSRMCRKPTFLLHAPMKRRNEKICPFCTFTCRFYRILTMFRVLWKVRF